MADITLGDVIIVGGGCYGTFYARQLLQARERGKASFTRLVLVDQNPACQFSRDIGSAPDHQLIVDDWDRFFDRDLAERRAAGPAPRPDMIVPSPLMPPLMYHWLLREARRRWPGREVETGPFPGAADTPYDRAVPDGTRYLSFADWLCPTHCIEPALCPVTRAPRTWEMADAVTDLTRRLGETRPAAGPVLFQCQHLVFGVGTFPVTQVLAGLALLWQAGDAGTAVELPVATLSSCHGALNLMRLGPA